MSNRALRGAFLKGVRAAMEGKPRKSSYYDHRTVAGYVTFSRAFNRWWLNGYDSTRKEKK